MEVIILKVVFFCCRCCFSGIKSEKSISSTMTVYRKSMITLPLLHSSLWVFDFLNSTNPHSPLKETVWPHGEECRLWDHITWFCSLVSTSTMWLYQVFRLSILALKKKSQNFVVCNSHFILCTIYWIKNSRLSWAVPLGSVWHQLVSPLLGWLLQSHAWRLSVLWPVSVSYGIPWSRTSTLGFGFS